jgi:hypothetical protein
MTEKASTAPVGASDIEAVARVVAPFAVRTPLLSFPVLKWCPSSRSDAEKISQALLTIIGLRSAYDPTRRFRKGHP